MVDDYDIDRMNEIISCQCYFPPSVEPAQHTVTFEELRKHVCESNGRVNASFNRPDGEEVTQYISFEEYLEEEFDKEAYQVLKGILNLKRFSHEKDSQSALAEDHT